MQIIRTLLKFGILLLITLCVYFVTWGWLAHLLLGNEQLSEPLHNALLNWLPFVLSFGAASLVLIFGAWEKATSWSERISLMLGLAILCVFLPDVARYLDMTIACFIFGACI